MNGVLNESGFMGKPQDATYKSYFKLGQTSESEEADLKFVLVGTSMN